MKDAGLDIGFDHLQCQLRLGFERAIFLWNTGFLAAFSKCPLTTSRSIWPDSVVYGALIYYQECHLEYAIKYSGIFK
jgi:hypothetical protein